MIYLDNAATTLRKPPCVIDAVVNAMQTMGNSGRSAHAESLTASRTIYAAREALAALFGCERADHVCFTANSTEALNIAISGLLAPGDHVLSADLEHNSVLRPLYREKERGVSVSFLPANRQGCIDYAGFDRLLQKNTRAVICTAGSNLTGNLLDLARIGAFCAAHGLLFVVDASQTAGVFPIDMCAQHISVLCFTGHKSLMGPQGTGGLWRGHPPVVRRRDRCTDVSAIAAAAVPDKARSRNAQRSRHRGSACRRGIHPGDGHGRNPHARTRAGPPVL